MTDLSTRYYGGESTHALATLTGRSATWVAARLREAGVTLRSRGGAHGGTARRDLPLRDLLSRRRLGDTYAALCARYGASEPTVRARYREALDHYGDAALYTPGWRR